MDCHKENSSSFHPSVKNIMVLYASMVLVYHHPGIKS
jgi:hypothetical protein